MLNLLGECVARLETDKHNQTIEADLTDEEIKVVLRALGYYQMHLFDEISKKEDDKNNNNNSVGSKNISPMSESQNATIAIKRIHKILEKREKAQAGAPTSIHKR